MEKTRHALRTQLKLNHGCAAYCALEAIIMSQGSQTKRIKSAEEVEELQVSDTENAALDETSKPANKNRMYGKHWTASWERHLSRTTYIISYRENNP